MYLTPEQQTTLAQHIRANQDPYIQAALVDRRDDLIAQWYNQPDGTLCWRSAMDGRALFDVIDVTKFDNLGTQGKRDGWSLMMTYGADMRRAGHRQVCVDIWGGTNSIPVLQGCRRPVSKVERVFGGTSATTNTVEATILVVEGELTTNNVSYALNDNP
jgi:hypothetical protein